MRKKKKKKVDKDKNKSNNRKYYGNRLISQRRSGTRARSKRKKERREKREKTERERESGREKARTVLAWRLETGKTGNESV